MFQDFGPLTERRRAEKEQKKKRIVIAGISGGALVVLLVVGVVAAVNLPGRHSSGDSPGGSRQGDQLHTASKSIQMICASTDYKKACESSLSKAANSSDLQPRDLIKAAIKAVTDEVAEAFSHSKLIKTDDPKVKGAIEDCKELYNYAEEELKQTLDDVHQLEQLPRKEHDLKTWLSAVMSYQQTCIDGFPEGELKEKMEGAMKTAKELTSNALAIVTQASSFLSSLHIEGLSLRRRLLSKEGIPEWVSDDDRRLLKEQPGKNLKPNVVVAQDGSGDFKTISDALAAIPEKYDGRYVIYVKAGIYDESPTVTKKMVNVTMYGDGSRKTIVTGSKNFVDGTRTFQTATFDSDHLVQEVESFILHEWFFRMASDDDDDDG